MQIRLRNVSLISAPSKADHQMLNGNRVRALQVAGKLCKENQTRARDGHLVIGSQWPDADASASIGSFPFGVSCTVLWVSLCFARYRIFRFKYVTDSCLTSYSLVVSVYRSESDAFSTYGRIEIGLNREYFYLQPVSSVKGMSCNYIRTMCIDVHW